MGPMPAEQTITMRVRYPEVDAMGYLHHSRYLQYFEIGRIEYLRSTGHSYAEVHDGGIDMVVAEASIHYRRPLRFDDEFVVECRLGELARASFTFSYRLLRDGQPVADGFTRHACVDRVTMRPVRLPEWLIGLGH